MKVPITFEPQRVELFEQSTIAIFRKTNLIYMKILKLTILIMTLAMMRVAVIVEEGEDKLADQVDLPDSLNLMNQSRPQINLSLFE
jgi:hypothetical protein